MRVLDLFSDVGCHALGLSRAGPFETVAFVESNPDRRAILAKHFPGTPIHDDVRTFAGVDAAVIFGGPPCQETSKAAAIHGRRSGVSLWPDMFRVGCASGVDWFVVDRGPASRARTARIEALGDANPPEMAEVIGLCLMEAA